MKPTGAIGAGELVLDEMPELVEQHRVIVLIGVFGGAQDVDLAPAVARRATAGVRALGPEHGERGRPGAEILDAFMANDAERRELHLIEEWSEAQPEWKPLESTGE